MFFLHGSSANDKNRVSIDLLLAYGATYRKVKRQEFIFKEGQLASFLYVIETGRVKMFNINDEGREFIQGIFLSGNSFGEPPVIVGEEYPANAIALDDSVLLRISREKLLLLLHENPNVHLQFTTMLASRLLAKAQNMKDLTSYGPEHRITSLLKQYKKHCGCPYGEKMRVELTRQEIADMTGLRVETVIRTMKAMEEKGLLHIENRKVLI
jgi:CRP/FNR family transcriptional regulator, cyclic AMP receptor protein